MNINVNSWHYKLVKNTFTSSKGIPQSLCPYMRAVLYRVLFLSAVGSGLTFMLSNMLLEPLVGFGLTGFWAYVASFFGSVIFLGGVLVFACVVVFGGVWCVQRAQEWWSDRKYDKKMARLEKEVEDAKNGIEPKQPNIVWAFVKAKHDKFCPSLNFTKTEKE